MAKRNKVGPGTRGEQSLILRSAETLGRMIGALHRQLDAVARQTAGPAPVSSTTSPSRVTPPAAATRKRTQPRKATVSRKTTPAPRATGIVARKAAAARKTTKRVKTSRRG